MELDRYQVQRVRKIILQRGLYYKSLEADILDHLCTMIEERMESQNFDEALDNSLALFTEQELIHTQCQTLKFINMEKYFSAKASFLATIPILLIGVLWIFTLNIPGFRGNFKSIIEILAFCSVFSLLILAWIKDFPRWSFPYIGFCILVCLYLAGCSIPNLTGNNRLGVWAFVPFIVTLFFAIILKPNIRPLKKLYAKIKEDKSLLFFFLYGFLPLVLWVSFDEMPYKNELPFAVILTIIMGCGIFIYLNNANGRVRVVSLITSSIIAIGIAFGYVFYYWA